jgi:NAD(P)-dependent dehydrogenase (short-subunit alcohol dehydrogenase family)
MAENDPDIRSIGERTFTAEDQELFARISRDRNPMHMDPIVARRLVTGRPVVHGVHLLMVALELWQGDGHAAPVAICCTFNNPVNVGDTVAFAQRVTASGYAVEASVGSLLCAQVDICTAPARESAVAGALTWREAVIDCTTATPIDEPPESHPGKTYAVRLKNADCSRSFPRACARLGPNGGAAVAALSYFVGMICPGLHSIFSSLELDMNAESGQAGHLTFQVRKYDPRFRLFDIFFDGCIRGSIKAFLRLPPQPQPSLRELSERVVAGEFRGTKSLVVGGSRGLGETTAKILAAGGGDVVLTYASGADDARMISDDINSAGKSRCDTVKFDLMTDTFDSMSVDCGALDAVYFFPTPRIFRKKSGTFDPSLFVEFYDFYVRRFYDLCAYLETNAGARAIRVFFPSSIAVAERPRGMTEYSMAKAAAEILIGDMNKSFANVSISCVRLPRLNTDQTATVLKVASESNVETLLPIVRSMRG